MAGIRAILLIALLGLANLAARPQQALDHSIDTLGFTQHVELAKWLYDYDEIAMLAMDSLKPLGKKNLLLMGDIGFCHKDVLDTWHILYGNTSDTGYKPVFHYWVDSLFTLQYNRTNVDNALYQSFSNAIRHCQKAMLSIQDSADIIFNQYIRDLPDQTIEVWILPAFQTSGQAIYGAEWMFRLKPDGSEILDTYTYYSGLKGIWIGQPRELWLNYRDTDSPTPGSIYFAWSFKDYFTKIHIDTRRCTCTIQKNNSGQYYWKNIFKP